MKAMLKKLKSKAGESLVESLAAILIFTLASVAMYTMVTTAADLNQTVKEMDEKNLSHLNAVEMALPAYKNGAAEIQFKLGSNVIAEVDVDVYGGQNGSLYTYFVHTD